MTESPLTLTFLPASCFVNPFSTLPQSLELKLVDDTDVLRAAVARIEATQVQMVATQTQMAVTQGTIEGVVSVMKTWGISIVAIVAAGGLGGVVYLGGEISDLRSEIASVNNYQKEETAKKLSDLQKSVDQLLASGKTPDTEDEQPSEKPAPKK